MIDLGIADLERAMETGKGTVDLERAMETGKGTVDLERATETGKGIVDLERATETGKGTVDLERAMETGKGTVDLERATETGKGTVDLERATETGKGTVDLERATETGKGTVDLERATETGKGTVDLERAMTRRGRLEVDSQTRTKGETVLIGTGGVTTMIEKGEMDLERATIGIEGESPTRETVIERDGLEVDFQTRTELHAETTRTEIETAVVTGRREGTLIILVSPETRTIVLKRMSFLLSQTNSLSIIYLSLSLS